MEGPSATRGPPPFVDNKVFQVVTSLPCGKFDKICLHAQRLCLLSARALDRYRLHPHGLSQREGFAYSLFCSSPFYHSLNIKWPVRFLVGAITVFAAIAANNLAAASDVGTIPSYHHYRFTALETRAGLPPETPGIHTFGLLRVGGAAGGGASTFGTREACMPLPGEAGARWAEGAAMTLSVAERSETRYAEWFITTQEGEGTQPTDAVKFVLEGSDDGEEWVRVGSSKPIDFYGKALLTTDAAEIPLERGTPLVLSATLSASSVYCNFTFSLFNFILALLATGPAVFGFASLSMVVIGWYHGLSCAMLLVGCAWRLSDVLSLEGDVGLKEVAPFINVVLRTLAGFVALYIYLFRQEWCDFYFVFIGVSTMTRAIVHHQILLGRPYEAKNLQLNMMANIFWISLGTFISFSRLRAILSAYNAMQANKARFDDVWGRVVEGQQNDLKTLQSVVESLHRESSGRLARQLTRGVSKGVIDLAKVTFGGDADSTDELMNNRRAEQNAPANSAAPSPHRSFRKSLSINVKMNRVLPISSSKSGLTWSFDMLGSRKESIGSDRNLETTELGLVHGTWSYSAAHFLQSDRLHNLVIDAQKNQAIMPSPEHVQSLDQLYAQAFLVQDIFLKWVAMLASNNRGTFRVRRPWDGSGGVDRFATWDGCEESRGTFEFGGLKGIRSSVLKLDVAYKKDVSRLLDVVRETIFFDNVGDLQRCLHMISKSKFVEVVQVKSTMTESAKGDDVWSQTGMRFVRVHVRLMRSPEARTLCVDTHVCELLLMLADFGRLQTTREKKDYREWSKCRRALQGTGNMFRRLFLRCALCRYMRAEAIQVADSTSPPSTEADGAVRPTTDALEAGNNHSLVHDVLQAAPARRTSLTLPLASVGLGNSGSLPLPSRTLRSGSLSVPSNARGLAGSWTTSQEVDRSAPEHLGTMPNAFLSLSFFKDQMNRSSLSVGNGKAVVEGAGGQTSWGTNMSAQVVELLESLGRISSLGLADFLDKRWELVRDRKMDKSSLSSVIFSSYPISASLQRWPFRLWCLGMGTLCAWTFCNRLTMYVAFSSGYAAGPYRYYRLETMLTRDGGVGEDILGPGVSDFGVVGSSGCHPNASHAPSMDESVPASFSFPVGSSFLVGYPEARSMKGWYLATGTGPVAHDPAFFSVWATNDDPDLGKAECGSQRHSGSWWEGGDREEWCGAAWDRVGTPKWRFTHDTNIDDMETQGKIRWVQLPVELPLSRNKIQTFLVQPPLHLYCWFLLFPPFFWGIGLYLSVFASILRLSKIPVILRGYPAVHGSIVMPDPHTFVASLTCIASGSIVIGGFVALSENVTHLAVECFAKASAWIVFAVAIYRQGPLTWRFIVFATVQDLVSTAAVIYWYHRDLTASMPSMTGLAGAVLSCLVFGLRRWELNESMGLLQKDRRKYDALWESQCAHEDSKACIEHLAKVVNMIGLRETDYCRQHNRMRAENLSAPLRTKFLSQAANSAPMNSLFWDLGRWYVPGRHSKTCEVRSLTQLYCTASIANLILVERLKDWAYRSQGWFHVEGDRERFVKWRDVRDDPEAAKHVLWAGLKRHTRTMEKLLRSYNNDLGRLLDISRNMIVFDNMSDLTMALGIIVTDENVRVDRLKNRLSGDYDSEETGGYRDVCINLRVINKQAFALGAELHMCEVQLILKDFANLRSKEGHRRYVRARNLSGR